MQEPVHEGGRHDRLVEDVGPVGEPTYTGREFDAKSGLYYYRARYYASDQGRFLSEDPIAHLNAYTYTQNDPVDFADPSGALAVEYQVLTASVQRANAASCIASEVGTVAGAAAAGVSAGFDQPGAAASQARNALVAGAITTVASCALAALPAGAAEDAGNLRLGSAKSWGNPKTLARHFADHGADFGAASPEEYASQASRFLQRSQAEGLPTKIDSEGIIRTYDPSTNEFGAYNPDGTTRTYFAPRRGQAYFDGQPGAAPWTPRQ